MALLLILNQKIYHRLIILFILSPCQNLSTAGKGEGLEVGTRSRFIMGNWKNSFWTKITK